MDTQAKKFLILHASAGHGHLKAAQATAAAVRRLYPDALVIVEDALDFFPKFLKSQYVGSYLFAITKAPLLWGVTYFVSDNRYLFPVTLLLRRLFNGLFGKRLEQLITEDRWDAVISTHFMPAEVSAHLKKSGKLRGRAVTVITDFLVHRFWISRDTDLYCVMCDETRAVLQSEGIAKDRIRVTGIPVAEDFAVREDVKAMRSKLGLPEDRFTVLFTSGGMGASSIQAPVAEFCRANPDAQALVVSGSNQSLKASLEKLAGELPNLTVYGFVNNMHELMTAADLIVGKAGGSTTSESLAKGVPMMILEPVPGQETFNRDILVGRGAALRVDRMSDVPAAIAAFRSDDAKRASVKAAIEAIAHPFAAEEVVRQAVS
ncbi:MAG: hypothetical protein KBD07_06345 [Candidatus Omnitrophica bacterium]|jgi:processive 1,2-diacylglycerol beta-glucosyltransferase|nr:hypothetical protein [Candidatus Omnitrophota bacterium]